LKWRFEKLSLDHDEVGGGLSGAHHEAHHGSLTISSGGQLVSGCEWIAAVAGDLSHRPRLHGAE
jgi:hypothetical protein